MRVETGKDQTSIGRSANPHRADPRLASSVRNPKARSPRSATLLGSAGMRGNVDVRHWGSTPLAEEGARVETANFGVVSSVERARMRAGGI